MKYHIMQYLYCIMSESVVGPILKFYLFPLTPLTLKKKPYSNFFFSIFSQDFFFNLLQTERIVQCKQCYLTKLFVYLILLPIVGLYSKTCIKWPQRHTQQMLLRQMGTKGRSRVLQNSPWDHSAIPFDMHYAIIGLEKTNNFCLFLSALLRQVLLYT